MIPALSLVGSFFAVMSGWSGIAAAAFIVWSVGCSYERRAARLGIRYSIISFVVFGSGALTCCAIAGLSDLLQFLFGRGGQ